MTGRDARTSVERVLRFCVSARLVHLPRIFPPDFSIKLQQECHKMILEFVFQHLYEGTRFSFWNKLHERLVRWNLGLRIRDGGTGLIPQWRLAHTSFAASWFQPLSTMAKA
jgi:hypothetical protein